MIRSPKNRQRRQAHGVTEDAFFAVMESKKAADTSRFPSDSEFASAIRTRPQYGWIPQHRLKLILEELEFAMRDRFNIQGTLQDGLTIEHVMPQNWPMHWPHCRIRPPMCRRF